MKDPENTISRRKWLGSLSVPALLAALPNLRSEPAAVEMAGGHPMAGVAGVYDVRGFGAKGDGVTLDTVAIQAAIDACARNGGGTVLIPAGTFVIGTVELKSNVTLHLAAAVLLGSGNGRHYHSVSAVPLHGDATLGDGNWAMLFAVGATRVRIEGSGVIDGQGQLFNSHGRRDIPPPSGIGGARRPYLVLLHRCEGVVLRDVQLVRGAFHAVRIIQSENIHIDGLYIHNRVNGNNDGFHFISARFVTISNCVVLCQDDACALFGSCQFVTVTNCVFSTRWSVFRFGGGQVKNIAVSNCVIYETYGCPIKIGAGRMQLENLSFSNLVLQDVTGPIGIGFDAGTRREDGGANAQGRSFVRNISFSNIRASTVAAPATAFADMPNIGRVHDGEQFSCIALNGVGDSWIEDVTFSDVRVTFAGGGSPGLAAKRNIPAVAREYFGVWSHPPFGPPAYGLFARNVRGLTLENVRFSVAAPDARPAVVFDHVREAAVSGLAAQGNRSAESVLRFSSVEDVLITAPRVLSPAAAFLQVEKPGSVNIVVDGGDISKASAPLVFRDGATANSTTVRR